MKTKKEKKEKERGVEENEEVEKEKGVEENEKVEKEGIQEKYKEEIENDSENRSRSNQEESDETISDHEFNIEEADQKTDAINKKQEAGEQETEEEQTVEMTLLDIKRKAQTECDAQKENTKQKKFRILNYSYKDSFVGKAEKDFFVYFCFLCGYNCLISEIDIKNLPKRKTDESIIFPLHKIVHKKNNNIHQDRILIKRGEEGVETQYRILCKECNVPIGYITNLKNDNMFIYYYDYALLNDETKCHIFKYT